MFFFFFARSNACFGTQNLSDSESAIQFSVVLNNSIIHYFSFRKRRPLMVHGRDGSDAPKTTDLARRPHLELHSSFVVVMVSA